MLRDELIEELNQRIHAKGLRIREVAEQLPRLGLNDDDARRATLMDEQKRLREDIQNLLLQRAALEDEE